MSARVFFDLRHTVPGYTFILWNLLINLRFVSFFFLELVPMANLSEASTLFGIVLGFLTLMSGSAIGFLVSQFWWLIFYYLRIEKWLNSLDTKAFGDKQQTKRLGEKYMIKNKEDEVIASDHIINSQKDEHVFQYMTRRWDLLVSFGSTLVAILLGSVVGISLRRAVLIVPPLYENWASAYVDWICFDHIILVGTVLIFLAICMGFYQVAHQHADMNNLLIKLEAEKLNKEKKESEDVYE